MKWIMNRYYFNRFCRRKAFVYGMTIHPVTLMGNYLAIRICFICPAV